MNDRELLLGLARAGLAAVEPRAATRNTLSAFLPDGRVDVLAVGKAAQSMAQGALDWLGDRVGEGLVIHPAEGLPLLDDGRFHCLAASHPLPDASSLRAGAEVLSWASARPPGRNVLLLVSGGASALLEALPEGVPPEVLVALNDWALASGHDIRTVNGLRRRLSRVKDGRLLARLSACRVTALYLSDVPNDDPTVLGSGLLGRAGAIEPLPADLPSSLAGWLACADLPTGHPPPTALACIGSVRTAMDAIAAAGRGLGLPAPVVLDLGGPAEQAAAEVLQCAGRHEGTWVIAGGETTVSLPARPGPGGRNQHLALAAAMGLAGRDSGALLALATDGRDGPGMAAGALVDSGTVERGRAAGLDPLRALASASSGEFLAASGDLLTTGPTGTNVGDLVIGKIRP